MGISLWQLLIVLVIVLLLFGTKKLRHLGSDLGSAVKGFKSAVTDGSKEVDEARLEAEEENAAEAAQRVADGEAVEEPAKSPNERA